MDLLPFSEKEIVNILSNSISYSDAIRKIFNKDYYNNGIKIKLLKLCEKVNFDFESHLKNMKIRKYCLCCGKELSNNRRKFCSSSCSAKFNNKNRKHNDETRKKISCSVKEKFSKLNHKKKVFIKKCAVCGKTFITKREKVTHCSRECVKNNLFLKEKQRECAIQLMKDGKIKPWSSRKVTSYPERFFIDVLNKNNISFEREYHVLNKYFLDFLIIKNNKKIDLEIDGKQHRFRKEHDINRDKFLTENGYIVYRIDWNCINNENGKLKMKEKINRFLMFYDEM